MMVTNSKTPCIIPLFPISLNAISATRNITALLTNTSGKKFHSSSPSNSVFQSNGLADCNKYITDIYLKYILIKKCALLFLGFEGSIGELKIRILLKGIENNIRLVQSIISCQPNTPKESHCTASTANISYLPPMYCFSGQYVLPLYLFLFKKIAMLIYIF